MFGKVLTNYMFYCCTFAYLFLFTVYDMGCVENMVQPVQYSVYVLNSRCEFKAGHYECEGQTKASTSALYWQETTCMYWNKFNPLCSVPKKHSIVRWSIGVFMFVYVLENEDIGTLHLALSARNTDKTESIRRIIVT